MFFVYHPDADWRMNAHRYDFGVFSRGSLSVRTTKHGDGTIEVCVEGLGESIVTTRRAIPTTDQPGVMVGLTWSDREVVFYLCGQRVDAVADGGNRAGFPGQGVRAGLHRCAAADAVEHPGRGSLRCLGRGGAEIGPFAVRTTPGNLRWEKIH